jgi:hypothetical protein
MDRVMLVKTAKKYRDGKTGLPVVKVKKKTKKKAKK